MNREITDDDSDNFYGIYVFGTNRKKEDKGAHFKIVHKESKNGTNCGTDKKEKFDIDKKLKSLLNNEEKKKLDDLSEITNKDKCFLIEMLLRKKDMEEAKINGPHYFISHETYYCYKNIKKNR